MKKIDNETVRRILDAADIVEVVSDFVSLKRRGANYIGLCPFHNERTPSFSVSKSKGICKCFSCGKGGSPVNFIMEHEQMTYYEALKYLAKKYNIEIKERELSDAEREAATERESMLSVNEFAMTHFEDNLLNTEDGRDIGLSYFRERGINDQSIKRFHLGYSLEQRDDLYKSALAKGFGEKYLVETGLVIRNEQGRVYDRFRGRVMYPVHTLSGKVIAFGGRTLRKDKEVAKYVNSPESKIYRKSYELYGLFQAKRAIEKKDKCILVEGYMDVISMSQSGVENVVASSGTSLTEGQIRLIHRFTENVTVIYDSDAAGIKASLRGIDMLLAEGLNIKVCLLPEGEDPDSYAQGHSTSELEAYLDEHETDFIQFKTEILLQGTENDPIKRSRVITDIVRSISVIPEPIPRQIYIKECSHRLDINERVLAQQVNKMMAERAENQKLQRDREHAAASIADIETEPAESPAQVAQNQPVSTVINVAPDKNARFLQKYERELLRYALKYGMLKLSDSTDDNGNVTGEIRVIDYIYWELKDDDIMFTDAMCSTTFNAALKLAHESWEDDYRVAEAQAVAQREEALKKGEDEIRATAQDLSEIKRKEAQLIESCNEAYNKALTDYAGLYIERNLTSSPDDGVRRLTTDLVSDKYVLSKVHTKYTKVETEQDRLVDLVPRAIYELKYAILECNLKSVREQLSIASSQGNAELTQALMKESMELMQIRSEFAKYLGERIVAPRK
jgi:DNA primase